MLRNNIYNIDREFNYATIKSIVVKSLEKIEEETLKKRANMPQNVIFDFQDNNYPDNVKLSAPSTPLLKLKIRNTTKYLNWRLWILKRDNFTCKICHASVKENKNLRLEVHHTKTFDDICKENSVSTVEQALGCEELWSMSNGISLCYTCHKYIESLRTKLRNIFLVRNLYL